MADAKRGREEDESGERAKKMTRRVELTKALADGQVHLDKLKQNDPQEIANLEKELEYVTNGAHRWTDNIFLFKRYNWCSPSPSTGIVRQAKHSTLQPLYLIRSNNSSSPINTPIMFLRS